MFILTHSIKTTMASTTNKISGVSGTASPHSYVALVSIKAIRNRVYPPVFVSASSTQRSPCYLMVILSKPRSRVSTDHREAPCSRSASSLAVNYSVLLCNDIFPCGPCRDTHGSIASWGKSRPQNPQMANLLGRPPERSSQCETRTIEERATLSCLESTAFRLEVRSRGRARTFSCGSTGRMRYPDPSKVNTPTPLEMQNRTADAICGLITGGQEWGARQVIMQIHSTFCVRD